MNRHITDKRGIVYELHKTAGKIFTQRQVIRKYEEDLWQENMVEMGVYLSKNYGFRFLIVE